MIDESGTSIPFGDQRLPRPHQDRSLHSAIADFEGSVFAGGVGDEDEDSLDYAVYLRRFERWVEEVGLVHDSLFPVVGGGREHDLTYVVEDASVLKFTKPSLAGYVVDFELGYPRLRIAKPLEYLRRQLLQNEIFSDNIRFVGLGGLRFNRRIVTRQPHVIGEDAGYDEITELMEGNLGFEKLRHNHVIGYEDSLAFVRADLAVFDLRPPNIIRTGAGLLIPIDCIPVKLTDRERALLGC